MRGLGRHRVHHKDYNPCTSGFLCQPSHPNLSLCVLLSLRVQELQAELDGAMDVDAAGAGGELDARVSLFDRCINAYGEARAAIKSALQLGASECGAGCWAGRAVVHVMQFIR